MNVKTLFCIALALVVSMASETFAQPGKDKDLWSFERVTDAMIPAGWKVEATTPLGPLATWAVAKDETAPGGGRVLAIVSPNYDFQHDEDVYHLCWTDKVSYKKGEIRIAETMSIAVALVSGL